MVRPVAKSSRVLTGRATEKQSRQSVRKMPWKVEKVIVRHLKPVVKKPQSNQSKSRSLKGATVSMKSPPAPRRKVGRIPALLEDDVGSRAPKGRLTVLEERSVSAEVQTQYRAYYVKFENFCRVSRKEKPAQSRLPLPRMIAAGMAMILCAWGKRLMSLKLMVDHDTYLRPGESIDLKGRDIVPPVRNGGKQYRWFAIVVRDSQDHKPDKTGVFDNSVPLNSVGREYLGQLRWERVLVLNGKDEMDSIRRCRIPKELSRGWSAAGIQEFASVPKQARRCIGRLEQWRKRSSCCQGSGQVATSSWPPTARAVAGGFHKCCRRRTLSYAKSSWMSVAHHQNLRAFVH
eukprot:symbB.v1.2.002617.t1/scaffold135.1/size305288/37